jgi:hypothetical protein
MALSPYSPVCVHDWEPRPAPPFAVVPGPRWESGSEAELPVHSQSAASRPVLSATARFVLEGLPPSARSKKMVSPPQVRRGCPNGKNIYNLLLSDRRFKYGFFTLGRQSGRNAGASGRFQHGHYPNIRRKCAEYGGNWYRWPDKGMEGWLCPALFKYFDQAPTELFVSVSSKS